MTTFPPPDPAVRFTGRSTPIRCWPFDDSRRRGGAVPLGPVRPKGLGPTYYLRTELLKFHLTHLKRIVRAMMRQSSPIDCRTSLHVCTGRELDIGTHALIALRNGPEKSPSNQHRHCQHIGINASIPKGATKHENGCHGV